MLAVLYFLTFIAVFTDLTKRIIPNWLVFAGITVGISYHIIQFEFIWLIDMPLVIIISFILWRVHMFGGGDSKFLIATAALMGGNWTFQMFFYSLICSLPTFLFYMIKEKNARPKIPFAIAFLGGVLWQTFWPLEGEIN